jgi:short-subunit dehydrogenase
VNKDAFLRRYGRVAVVAGASEGLGAAFAEALAARGLHLVLLARRHDALVEHAAKLERDYGVSVRAVACDLKDASFVTKLQEAVANQDVGLAIYNAAFSVLGPLLDRPLEDALQVVDVNVKGPLRMIHALGPAMCQKRRGGIVLMASIAGFQGAPRLAAYAASKAFNIVLGESLWAELRPSGVDVLVSCAGAIRTPNYRRALAREAPGTLDAQIVAERTLDALGSGPATVPGAVNKLATFVLGRLLPRANAVALMDKSTRSLEDSS